MENLVEVSDMVYFNKDRHTPWRSASNLLSPNGWWLQTRTCHGLTHLRDSWPVWSEQSEKEGRIYSNSAFLLVAAGLFPSSALANHWGFKLRIMRWRTFIYFYSVFQIWNVDHTSLGLGLKYMNFNMVETFQTILSFKQDFQRVWSLLSDSLICWVNSAYLVVG